MKPTSSIASLPENVILELYCKIRDPWEARTLTLALGDKHVPRHERSEEERATVRYRILQRRCRTARPTVHAVYGSFCPSFLLGPDERREAARAAEEVHVLLPLEWTADEALFRILSKNKKDEATTPITGASVILQFQSVFSAALVAHVVSGNTWFTRDGKGAWLMHRILEISGSSRFHVGQVYTWAYANLCEAFMYLRASGRPYSSDAVRGVSDVFALLGQQPHRRPYHFSAVTFLCGPSIVSSLRSVLAPDAPDALLHDWFRPMMKSVLTKVSSLRVLLNAVSFKMPAIRPSASRWIATRFIPSFRTHGTRVRALHTLFRAVYRTTRGCTDDFFQACDVALCVHYKTMIPSIDEDDDTVHVSSVHSVCSAFFSEEALRFVSAWRSVVTLDYVDRALSLFGKCCRKSVETDGKNHDRLKSALHFLIVLSEKNDASEQEPYAIAVLLVCDTFEHSVVRLLPSPPSSARLFMEAVRVRRAICKCYYL